jgi:hypothetical protein
MSFCGSCGVQLSGSEKFCQQCGAPLTATGSGLSATPANNRQSAQYIPAPGEPQVLNVLSNAEIRSPSGTSDIYTLVFTDRQVILAKLTGEIIRDMQNKAQARSKAEGKGWLGRTRDAMKASGAVGDRYAGMASGQILGETTGNFAIDHEAVGSVSIKDVWESSNQDVPDDRWTELIFTTTSGSLKCRLRKQTKDVPDVLRRFYPGRVTGQK